MIETHESSEIACSEPPGPKLSRGYVCPTMPNVERLICGSCSHIALPGQEIVHSRECAWLKWKSNSE